MTYSRDDSLMNAATITAGVIRWNSNGSVPPADCVARAVELGLPVDVAACTAARAEDLTAFLTEYRRLKAGPPSEEERAEARAAHGPGVKLVNVITGRTFVT